MECPFTSVSGHFFIGNSYEAKSSVWDAQLAEKKAVALQHCSRAKSSLANSLFLFSIKKLGELYEIGYNIINYGYGGI